MHTDAYDVLVNLKKYIRESSVEPLGRIGCIQLIDEFIEKAVMRTLPNCPDCHHDLPGNEHGFDQNDAWIDGDRLVHSGRCTYCRECQNGGS